MNIKLREIRDNEKSLEMFFRCDDIPIKASYKISKFAEEIVGEIGRIETARVQLVKKYGETDEKGNFKVKEEKVGEFMAEFNEFLEEDITVKYQPIPVSELGDIKLSPMNVVALKKFIKFEE